MAPTVEMLVEGWAGTEIPSGAMLANGVGTAGSKRKVFSFMAFGQTISHVSPDGFIKARFGS